MIYLIIRLVIKNSEFVCDKTDFFHISFTIKKHFYEVFLPLTNHLYICYLTAFIV